MRARVKQLDALGKLTKVGEGGQGVIYSSPGVKTHFAESMVYKQYKRQVAGQVDFAALAEMPALVEDSLAYRDGERLTSMAAWPCEIVEDDGKPIGFLMPEIPERFNISLTTLKGVSRDLAEFQHLLNPQEVLDARGIIIDDVQRYKLLGEVASGLAFLHDNGVCVGDISPKNLLFSFGPVEAVYFVDCDAMRINGKSALPQAETLGWEVPVGEELATVYSDAYKLGLLALRLIVGSQITKTPENLPESVPTALRRIITDTLKSAPEKRPLPDAWAYVLGDAVEVEEGRRSKRSAPRRAPEKAAAKAVNSTPPASTSSSGMWTDPTLDLIPSGAKAALIVAAAAAVAVVGTVIAVSISSTPSSSASSASSKSSYSSPVYSSSIPYTTLYREPMPSRIDSTYAESVPPEREEVPPIIQGRDTYGESCDGGYYMTSRTGWGTRSRRGSASTTCKFADSVLGAYWAKGDPVRGLRTISAPGRVPCPSVYGAICEGQNFILKCKEENSAGWITCRGGRDAIIYLY